MVILLVDDEEWNISKLRRTLRQNYGARVEYASTVDDALEMLQDMNTIDAVVTDFNLDTLNGKQLITLLRGNYGDVELTSLTEQDVADCDNDIADSISGNFETFAAYLSLVERTKLVPYVLFSSKTYGDGDQSTNPPGIFVELKANDEPANYRAERNIANWLDDQGVLHKVEKL